MVDLVLGEKWSNRPIHTHIDYTYNLLGITIVCLLPYPHFEPFVHPADLLFNLWNPDSGSNRVKGPVAEFYHWTDPQLS